MGQLPTAELTPEQAENIQSLLVFKGDSVTTKESLEKLQTAITEGVFVFEGETQTKDHANSGTSH